MTGMREAAVAYAVAGYEVFPLRGKLPHGNCPACEPRSPRYQPHTAGECEHELCHGLYAATCDPARVARWWTRWPQANIGTRVPASLLVLTSTRATAATKAHPTRARPRPASTHTE